MGGLYAHLRHPGPPALEVELACAGGEVLALVGPSGSGKTTVLRALAGLVRPAWAEIRCGSVTWQQGAAHTALAPGARRIGMVFQDYALLPHLSAWRNVALALGDVPGGQRRRRARAWLECVHLSGLEDRHPHQLSGGQRQRVAMARALARDPALLLLDEPFSAVDQRTRERLQMELATLRGSLGMPVVLVTHDLQEARALADRIAVIHHGRTLQQGAIDRVIRNPASRTVARLLGHDNLFRGRLVTTATPTRPGRLRWRDRTLEVADTGDLTAGSEVDWLVAADHIVLHRRGRPSRGERENPVPGTVQTLMPRGTHWQVRLAIDGQPPQALSFSLPAHSARRNGLAPGVDATVSLLADGIHLMPPQPPESPARD